LTAISPTFDLQRKHQTVNAGHRVSPFHSIPDAVSSLRLAQAADYLRKQGAPCIAAALLGTPP